MISKIECLCYVEIAIINLIEKGITIEPYTVYCEIKELLKI